MIANFFCSCCAFCCCGRDHERDILARKDVESEIDIVSFLKRMRMHGFALGLLMNHRERHLAAVYGQKRDIRHLENFQN